MATVSNTATSARSSTDSRLGIAPGHKVIARAGIAAGALLAAAVFVPASLADWAAVDHAPAAAKIAPWNASSAAAAAAALGADPRKPEVRELVRRALARDVTLVPALEVRAVDLALSGKATEARALFHLSDQLSRRNLPTRLWLIQDAVDHGDVAGALKNFDIALRTTTDAQPILFPVLAKATGDPNLTVPISRMLDRPSDWRLMFFEWALTNPAHVGGVANVAAEMRDRQFLVGNSIDQRLVERLVTDRDFAAASLLNRRIGGQSGGVVDSHFADPSAHYPFGWGLVSDGSLTAERAVEGSSPVLRYGAVPAHSGQIAAQLLMLRPGRYELATRTAGQTTGEAPYWSVSCGEVGGGELVRLAQPVNAGDETNAIFTVPTSCGAQWLTLRVPPSGDASPPSGAIAWVQVSPR